MGASRSSKAGGGGGRGGKLYNFASLAMDEGGPEEDEEAVSSLSVSLVEVENLIGAAVDIGSSRAGSRGGPERVALRSAS